MTIVEKKTGKDGTLWGWDDRQGDWIELDKTAEEGSFLGNVGRSALSSFRDIGQGISEIGQPDFANVGSGMLAPTQSYRNREALQAEQQAQANAAPAASSLGQSAPEVLATGAAALATGGMGVPIGLLAQAAAGGLTGLLRPGDLAERAAHGAFGAAIGITGELGAAGVSAAKGIMLGTRLSEALAGRAAGRVANELDTGLAGGVARDSRVGAARPFSEGGEGASVGAAGAPLNEGEQGGLEGLAARRDDVTGARVVSRNDQIDRQWAEEQLGYKSPLGAGTHGMSASRLAEGFGEYTAIGDSVNQTYRAGNQKLLARTAAKAMGDPDWAAKDVIELDDLGLTRGRLGNTYDQVERRMPDIAGQDVANAIRPAIKEGGPFESTEFERFLKNGAEKAAKTENYSGAEAVSMLRRLGQKSTEASAKGDQHGAEMLMEVRQRLNDVLERQAQKRGDDALFETLRTANSQYRIMSMLEAGASVGATRDVNPATLLNRMRRNPTAGGYGSKGPPRGTPEGDLYRLIKLMAKDQTNIPATGVRQLISRKVIGQGVGALGLGALGGSLLGGH